MKDLLPEWIENYEGFQEMPLELSADIDRLLETHEMIPDIEEIRGFLADRYNTLQDEIDRWKAVAASGSKVLLMNEDERAGWDARVEAEELERSTRNTSTE
ncbi:hypothetical protein LCGC14_1338610 [marine sediment metagenome]|uniref:Uncharacterized protein n=1 Tax=marine sediment metagenome TaxID=412755 RepID=A0A0F9KE62_9ZZZZ